MTTKQKISNKNRQASFKAKMQEQGLRQMTVWVPEECYAAFKEAAEAAVRSAQAGKGGLEPITLREVDTGKFVSVSKLLKARA